MGRIRAFYRKHKVLCIVLGVATAVGSAIIVVLNKMSTESKCAQIDLDPLSFDDYGLEDVNDKSECIVTKVINDGEPFPVSGGVRNLHDGWHASEEKILEARELGIELGEGQTLVKDYWKNIA